MRNIYEAPMPVYPVFKPTGLSKSQVCQQMNIPAVQKILLDQGCDSHLLIVGESLEGKSGHLAQIHRQDLNSQIHRFDAYNRDEQVAGFFEAAELFVAPKIDGTQSAALKTALGFGLPVVVTDGIMDELIASHSERCKVVPSGDSAALAGSWRSSRYRCKA